MPGLTRGARHGNKSRRHPGFAEFDKTVTLGAPANPGNANANGNANGAGGVGDDANDGGGTWSGGNVNPAWLPGNPRDRTRSVLPDRSNRWRR
jgi:hypothetical protein